LRKRDTRPNAQIALRWLIQQGNIVPIPRSANPRHIAENLDVFSFTLSDDEMSRIFALKLPDGRLSSPAGQAPDGD
jgi:diketogulonate reductase-like aldo/keto reductase